MTANSSVRFSPLSDTSSISSNVLLKGESTARPYRVLHGVTGAAGQAHALAQGLKAHGITAENVLIGKSRYGYRADHHVEATHRGLSQFLINNIDRFDIFHLHFRPIFYEDSKRLQFPSFADFPILKAAGKRIVFHFRGSEIRSHSEFQKHSPYNYIKEDAGRTVRKFPDTVKARVLRLVRAGSDAVLANDPEIASYIGVPCRIINRIVELPPERCIAAPARAARPFVVHAPSRRGVKGTDWVIETVDALRAEGAAFDFQLVEGMSHDEAMDVYARADIVVDQLRIGWYGVLSVEAMGLGKAVMCYIRDDLVPALGETPPMVLTRRETLKADLRGLIENPNRRAALGRRGRHYFETRHSRDAVLPDLISVYDDVWANPRPFDPVPFLNLVAQQHALGISRAPARSKDGYFPNSALGKAAFLLETQGVGSVVRRLGRKLPRRQGRGSNPNPEAAPASDVRAASSDTSGPIPGDQTR